MGWKMLRTFGWSWGEAYNTGGELKIKEECMLIGWRVHKCSAYWDGWLYCTTLEHVVGQFYRGQVLPWCTTVPETGLVDITAVAGQGGVQAKGQGEGTTETTASDVLPRPNVDVLISREGARLSTPIQLNGKFKGVSYSLLHSRGILGVVSTLRNPRR